MFVMWFRGFGAGGCLFACLLLFVVGWVVRVVCSVFACGLWFGLVWFGLDFVACLSVGLLMLRVAVNSVGMILAK